MDTRQSAPDRERSHPERPGGRPAPGALAGPLPARVQAERAARATLRGQIARLQGEIAALVSRRFPFLAPPAVGALDQPQGPHLPDLGELERIRDRLAGRLAELRVLAERRSEHERRAHELLERMRSEPGRYRHWRLPVRDLGEAGCGVWEVRPRLGLIGMLAGWWELKLSSGCP